MVVVRRAGEEAGLERWVLRLWLRLMFNVIKNQNYTRVFGTGTEA